MIDTAKAPIMAYNEKNWDAVGDAETRLTGL